MLLNEITYSILELLRNGSIVDDESLDIRLIEFFVKNKRAEYIQSIIDKGKPLPEQFYQYLSESTVMDSFPNENILKLTNDLPNIVGNRNGNTIKEVTSTDLSQVNFSLINNNRFRVAGNGTFNKDTIFVTYRDNNLYFKSANNRHVELTNVLIKLVLENPKDDPSFTASADNYPITMQCYEYIKDSIMSKDIKLFMAGIADEINDSEDSTK